MRKTRRGQKRHEAAEERVHLPKQPLHILGATELSTADKPQWSRVESGSSPIQNSRRSPEDSNQRGVNGVSIIDVHVVPAALCGKVIEAQPEYCIRTGRQGERGD